MAKVIIFNATPYKVRFKGEWSISLFTKDHAEKEIVGFGNNWIDNLWYELDFSVKTKDKPYIDDNHGKVPSTETRAYLISCKENNGVCCSQLNCGDHVSQLKIHGYYIDAVKKLISCLKEQIDKGIGDIKELKKQLKEAVKALSDIEAVYGFIANVRAEACS